MKKYVIFYILLFLIIFSCGKKYINEIEPNQTRWQAQKIEIPLRLKAVIQNRNDIDYFKFVSIEDQDFDIEIELKTRVPNPLKLSIYFQDKLIKSVYLLKHEFKNGEQVIKIKNIYVKSGTYFIRIKQKRKWDKQIPYTLIVNRIGHNFDEEIEPNDTISEASEINLIESYIKAYFSPQWNGALEGENYREVDWFRFFVSEKSNLVSLELTGVPDVDPVVELYNELGIRLKKIDSSGIDEPEVLKNYGILQPGYYYVKIYSKNLGEKNNNIPYKLYVNIKEYKKEFEFEPNDSMSSANYISNSIKGFINPSGDIDWFYFYINGDSPSLLDISITPISDIDFVLKLYNQTGEKLFTLNAYPEDQSEVFPDFYIQPGKYYIAVQNTKSDTQNINKYYTLYIKSQIYPGDFEIEPNNNFENATLIELNSSIKGYISPTGDIDSYIFTINTNKRIKLSISPIPAVDTVIEIYNSDRELIQRINKNRAGEGETEYTELSAGKYYVILKDAENRGSNYYEKYIFTILER